MKNPVTDSLRRALVYSLIVVVGLVSADCSHRSGRRKNDRNRQEDSRPSRRSRREKNPELPQARRNTSEKLDGSQIFRRYDAAVFMVVTTDGVNTRQGSGFFISPDGLAVSNYHVFSGTGVGAEGIKLSGSEQIYKVEEVLASSREEDFILFRVSIDRTDYIPVGWEKPGVGDKVYAIGSPRGLENTFSSGEISQWRGENMMQTNVMIDHGSSGGPLINEYGQVVGITSGTFCDGSQANLNYAWSINVIKPYVRGS